MQLENSAQHSARLDEHQQPKTRDGDLSPDPEDPTRSPTRPACHLAPNLTRHSPRPAVGNNGGAVEIPNHAIELRPCDDAAASSHCANAPNPAALASCTTAHHWAPPILGIEHVHPLVGGWEAGGAHGHVREGVWLNGAGCALRVAIKSANERTNRDCQDLIRKEFDILVKIPYHPNIIWVIGKRVDGNCLLSAFVRNVKRRPLASAKGDAGP